MAGEALYGRLAPYYDLIYGAKAYPAEMRRLLALARRHLGRAPRSILDVGCGTGRHLEAVPASLERAGVDLNRAMLTVARTRLPRSVRLVRGDMRSFDLGRSFDVIVCLFSAIGYLARRADREAAFANFRRHLTPGGVVLVEGWIRPSEFLPHHVALLTVDRPDLKIARVSEIRREGAFSRLEMQYLIARPGRPIVHATEVHRNALVEPEEMLASMRRAGLGARVRWDGAYRTRGLYIGVRPQHDLGAVTARRARPRG